MHNSQLRSEVECGLLGHEWRLTLGATKAMHTLAQRRAEYAAGLDFSQLPPTVAHEVKRRIVESLGCALDWRKFR